MTSRATSLAAFGIQLDHTRLPARPRAYGSTPLGLLGRLRILAWCGSVCATLIGAAPALADVCMTDRIDHLVTITWDIDLPNESPAGVSDYWFALEYNYYGWRNAASGMHTCTAFQMPPPAMYCTNWTPTAISGTVTVSLRPGERVDLRLRLGSIVTTLGGVAYADGGKNITITGTGSTDGTLETTCAACDEEAEELVGWWPFDEGLGLNGHDSTTNQLDGVLLGSPLPTWTQGILAKALQFDGTQNYVSVLDDAKLSVCDGLTVSAWVNRSSAQDGFTVSKWASDGLSGSYLVSITPTNAAFRVYLDGSEVGVVGTNSLSVSDWHHVAGTYDGNSLSLYVDGQLDGTVAATGTIDASAAPLLIGGVAGAVDDARIYNYALASPDVLALYQADTDGDGLPNWWQIRQFGQTGIAPGADPDGDGGTNFQEYQNGTDPNEYYNGTVPALVILSGNNQTGLTDAFLAQPLVITVINDDGTPLTNAPVTFTVTQGNGQLASATNSATLVSSLAIRTDANGQAAACLLLPPTAGTNLVTVSTVSAGVTYSVPFCATSTEPYIPPGLLAHWAFDEGSGTTVGDSTTNHLDGTLSGNPLPTWTSGLLSNALQFDVINHVSVPHAVLLSPRDGLTVSAWVNLSLAQDGFTVSKWASDGLRGSYLLWVTPTNTEFHVFLNGTQTTVTGTHPLTTADWHLIVGTYTGSNLNLYVDGVLDNSVAATGRIDVVAEPLHMGGVAGRLDEVRLYGSALTADDVFNLALGHWYLDTDHDGLSDPWEIQHFGTLSLVGKRGRPGEVRRVSPPAPRDAGAPRSSR